MKNQKGRIFLLINCIDQARKIVKLSLKTFFSSTNKPIEAEYGEFNTGSKIYKNTLLLWFK